MGAQPNNKKSCGYVSWQFVVCVIIIVAANAVVAAVYGSFEKLVRYRVNHASQVCDDGDKGAYKFENPKPQTLSTWFFNVANPDDYVNGLDIELDETALYGFQLTVRRADVTYSDNGESVSYTMYYEVSADDDASCDDCNSREDKITVFSVAYNLLLSSFRNEYVMLAKMRGCTTGQIGAFNTAMCTDAEVGTATVCACCRFGAPALMADPNRCYNYFSYENDNKFSGILSWLAKYDGGYQMSETAQTYEGWPLATGKYTPTIIDRTPLQVLRGQPSPLVGYFKGFTSAGDTDTLDLLAEVTNDLYTVCKDSCTIPDNQEDVLTYTCDTIISVDEDHEDYDTLRYLDGVNCNAIVPALQIAKLVELSGDDGSITCHGEYDAPCCPTAYSFDYVFDDFGNETTFTGAYHGCVAYQNGLLAERPVYNVEDAEKYHSPVGYTVQKTGCASGDEKFEQVTFKDSDEVKTWLQIDQTAYQYSWADPLIMSVAATGSATTAAGTLTGSLVYTNISGKQFNMREGRKVDGKFLGLYLTKSGKPLEKEYEIFLPFRRTVLTTQYERTFLEEGVEINKFNYVWDDNFTVAESNELGNNGQQPYPNMQNMYYALGVPVIMSLPNFYKVNSDILYQNDNTDSGTTTVSTTGVGLYSTHDSYKKNAGVLDTKERITESTLAAKGDEHYVGYMHVEPATGATVGGTIVNMISTFSMHCNPNIDGSCRYVSESTSISECTYTLGVSRSTACSAANILTPKVFGGKVTPLFWMSLEPETATALDTIRYAMNVRQTLSVLILVIPLLSAILYILMMKYEFFNDNTEEKPKTEENENDKL